jgi:hypothetical protein
MAIVHCFQKALTRSRELLDDAWWESIYRQAFPDFASMVAVRQDGWAQRGGIDRIIVLASGRTLTVDEKVRSEHWPDILLEYWSDEGRRVPGWVAKELACDYVAYAMAAVGVCYLFPFQDLRRAWRRHHRSWVKRYREVRAQNAGYVTVSVAVPTDVLLAALASGTQVRLA